jgi:hypothetical protein
MGLDRWNLQLCLARPFALALSALAADRASRLCEDAMRVLVSGGAGFIGSHVPMVLSQKVTPWPCSTI